MANITAEENFISELTLAGIITLSAGVNGFFAALNIFLAITASVGNALILVALHKATFMIYPPTKLFFRCLAVTDLCVGLGVQPLYVADMLAPFKDMNSNAQSSIINIKHVSGFILCGVSVLTSAAISVERLLALLLGLRYGHVVTLRRVRVVIICLWFISASVGSTIVMPVDIARKLASALLLTLLVISIYCYTRIFFKQALVQNHVCHRQANGGGNSLNIARYKKSVSSVLWVQLALVACYAPWGILNVLFVSAGIDNYVAWRVTVTLIYFNSSLNPILCCWKIRAVRQAVKDTVRQLNCLNFLNN